MATLNQLLEQVPENKRPSAKQIVRELNFINRTLSKLRKEIDDHGVTEVFQNGKQCFTRESSALKSYNTTLQRFSTLHKQLCSLLPEGFEAEDDFDRFLRGEELE